DAVVEEGRRAGSEITLIPAASSEDEVQQAVTRSGADSLIIVSDSAVGEDPRGDIMGELQSTLSPLLHAARVAAASRNISQIVVVTRAGSSVKPDESVHPHQAALRAM